MDKMDPEPKKYYGYWLILAAVLALLSGIWAGSRFVFVSNPSAPSGIRGGTLISQPRPLVPFNLRDDRGQTFNLDSLRGHWTFIAIGYTHCPDICPTTLANFTRIKRLVDEAGSNPRLDLVFVSVDPERDTEARLGEYIRYFHPGLRGVTGSLTELQGFTKQLGLVFARVENQAMASANYLVDHSASILLIDPLARLTAVFGAPQNPEVMAGDFLVIAR